MHLAVKRTMQSTVIVINNIVRALDWHPPSSTHSYVSIILIPQREPPDHPTCLFCDHVGCMVMGPYIWWVHYTVMRKKLSICDLIFPRRILSSNSNILHLMKEFARNFTSVYKSWINQSIYTIRRQAHRQMLKSIHFWDRTHPFALMVSTILATSKYESYWSLLSSLATNLNKRIIWPRI